MKAGKNCSSQIRKLHQAREVMTMLQITEEILGESRGVVTPAVLRRIMEKIEHVMKDGRDRTACGEEPPRLYVTPGKKTHLTAMQKLGLAEKNPIHKRGCGCDPKENLKNAYGLTRKAWIWYIECHLLFEIRLA
jgi:hypothetical protein